MFDLTNFPLITLPESSHENFQKILCRDFNKLLKLNPDQFTSNGQVYTLIMKGLRVHKILFDYLHDKYGIEYGESFRDSIDYFNLRVYTAFVHYVLYSEITNQSCIDLNKKSDNELLGIKVCYTLYKNKFIQIFEQNGYSIQEDNKHIWVTKS